MKSSTYEIRDCFAPLATTTLETFYETIKYQNRRQILNPNYYYSDDSQNPPYSPFAKGGNCYPPLWKRGASLPAGRQGEIF